MNVIEEVQMNQRLDDEIDFLGLAQVVWRGKWYIGGVTFVAALLAVFVMLLIPNQYTAQALLAPRDDQSGGGLAGLASQYGGLASLAGISIPSGSNDKVDLGIQVLKSRKFITGFIERHDILVPLLAAEKWDRESDQLIIDEDDYDTSENKWVRSVRPQKRPHHP
jgi:Chain length determinant protein